MEGNEGDTMSACSQCGTVVKPADKFCNICGSPIARPTAPPGIQPGYSGPGASPTFASQGAAPPDPYSPAGQGGYGQPPPPGAGAAPARCQLGHDIAPGASYCAQGHPIALDQMQFANDPYGGGGGYGQPPPQPPAYGAPRPQAPYPTAAAPAYGGQPPPPQGGYAPPPNQAAYASAFGAPAAQGGYAPPPPQPPVYTPAPPAPYAPPAPAPQAAPLPPFGSDAAREAAPPRILRGFLVAYGTNPSGDFWPLTAGRHTVGRFGTGDGLDVPLQDPTISSRHAALVVDAANNSVSVEDTGSTNGTFVNDEHIGYGGRRELRDGDRLRFGGFTTVVKVIGRV